MPPLTAEDSPRPGWLFWLAFAAALGARFALLAVRPLHHDEGVNAWFLNDLLAGRGYRYNPEAFHGPFLYLWGWPFSRLLGVDTIALRLPVALASALMIPLLLPLRRRLGVWGITGAAWLLALSPALVVYGRDLIHETYLAFFTLALAVAASLWLESGRRRDLLLAAAAFALLFTVKETAVLAAGGLAGAAVVAWGVEGTGERLPRFGRKDLALAAALGLGLYVFFFTTAFTNPMGLIDSLRAFLPWAEKGVQGVGHEKPWTYFFALLLRFEPVTALCAVGGAAVAIWRRDRFSLFCALWAAGQVAVYSAIPYKTPWLVINMVVPLVLTAGVLVQEAAARPWPLAARGALAALLVAGLAWGAWRAADVAVRRYDDASLGLVYSDTSRQVWDLLALVRGTAAKVPDPPGASVAVYVEGRWPLPWYLRDLTRIRWPHDIPDDIEAVATDDIVIVDRAREAPLRPLLRQGYRRREFLLRPAVPVAVYTRPADQPQEDGR